MVKASKSSSKSASGSKRASGTKASRQGASSAAPRASKGTRTAASKPAVKKVAKNAPKAAPKKAAPKKAVKSAAASATSKVTKKAAPKKPTKAATAKPAKTAKPIKPSKAPKKPAAQKATKAPRVKPASPGRMRAPIAPIDTIRTPAKADDLKARLGRISGVIAQLRGHKRTLERTFYDVGELLTEVNDARLFEVKGYGSLEAFLDRETELGSNAGMRALRATTIFQRDAAQAAGFTRISAALRALDGEHDAPSVGDRLSAGSLPPHKL